jgi:DNA-binding winged helix-turn-helix (wHTH) protein/tetratricopeptide (TPR) repeat protein
VEDGRQLRFADFEFRDDPRLPELSRRGVPVKLQEQPLRLLALLLGSPGKLVTREQLRTSIWPADTFVDFEHGLHRAVNKLRAALDESAATPLYIETIPRKGYRFICPVEPVTSGTNRASGDTPSGGPPKFPPASLRPPFPLHAAISALVLVCLAFIAGASLRSPAVGAMVTGERTISTSSVEARRLFLAAMDQLDADDDRGAAESFEAALKHDPGFASAHVYLAHCYSNLKNSSAAATHFERALQLAPSVSDAEQLFIEASYYGGVGQDQQRALAAYRSLAQLDPSHYWAVNNLALTLLADGFLEEAWPLMVRRSDLRPTLFDLAVQALVAIERAGGNQTEAGRMLLRAQQLAGEEAARKYPYAWIQFELREVGQRQMQGDLGGASMLTDKLLASLDDFQGKVRDEIAYRLTYTLISLGRLRQARTVAEAIRNGTGREFLVAVVAHAGGDWRPLADYLKRQVKTGVGMGPGTLWRLPDVGLYREADSVLNNLDRFGIQEDETPLLRGKLALSRGNLADARLHLRRSFDRALRQADHNAITPCALALAKALELTGDPDGAVATLEAALAAPQSPFAVGAGATQRGALIAELMRLQNGRGNYQRAQQLRADLEKLLLVADHDHPLRRWVQAGNQARTPGQGFKTGAASSPGHS